MKRSTTSLSTPTLSSLSPAERWRFHLRQLQWLLCSPSLLSNNAGRLFGNDEAKVVHLNAAQKNCAQAWLNSLSAATVSDIDQWLPELEAAGAAPLRLGRYAERLLGFYLRHAGEYMLVAEQLQLRELDAQTGYIETRGEFDFLLRDHAQQLHHWELAVKFFLCEAGAQTDDSKPPKSTAGSTFSGDCSALAYVGPDGRENLHRKLTKVFQRQLQTPLPDPFNVLAVQRSSYSAGWLFYRGNDAAQCAAVNTEHNRGQWINAAELDHLPSGDYVHVPRWRWLAPAFAFAEEVPMGRKDLPAALSAHWQSLGDQARAVLIANIDANGEERARFFVRVGSI
jgi:uncharacterized protein